MFCVILGLKQISSGGQKNFFIQPMYDMDFTMSMSVIKTIKVQTYVRKIFPELNTGTDLAAFSG